MNTLYYGDNLKIMRDYIKDESVDLVYLDPPFNSNRNYNVLFRNESGAEAESQITAFEDTWHWNLAAEETYSELINRPDQVGRMIESFRQFIGTNQMMAYLVMMAVRLKELHRVLKPTGSLYLHCDPTASHYLKILLDTLFGAQNYRNEITWKRTFAHGNVGKNYGNVADLIFFFTKSDVYTWNQPFAQLTLEERAKKYPKQDPDGRRWQSVSLRNPAWRPNLQFPYTASNGVTYHPHPNGWAGNKEHLERLDKAKKLHFPSKPDGALRLKMYEDESKGERLQNIWHDIPPIGAQAQERLGYPTQKPVTLLERIVSASSNEGDVVLDPFCGCGTTIAAAQKLNREWIGIDVTHLAVGLMKLRLKDSFGMVPVGTKDTLPRVSEPGAIATGFPAADDKNPVTTVPGSDKRPDTYRVVGQPEDLDGAKELAEKDRYGFQWWILPLIGAKAYGSEAGSKEGKKGADKGIDGNMVFTDDTFGKAKRVVVSVKSGHPNVSHIRDLGHVIERENAAIGVYLTLEPPTAPMLKEAAEKGFYHSPGWNKDYPRIQILTVEDLLDGKTVDLPPNLQTFKQAGRVASEHNDQGSLGF
ncbi:MAG: site-specific DNA-methyltransferase [Pyrinomonadaceae bacterium]